MPNNMYLRECNEEAKKLAFKMTACLGTRNALRIVKFCEKILSKQQRKLAKNPL